MSDPYNIDLENCFNSSSDDDSDFEDFCESESEEMDGEVEQGMLIPVVEGADAKV
jgi:hypothetical protein